ncbi:MAG TPA: MFS transporter [Streptosporangiaceae bacterium]
MADVAEESAEFGEWVAMSEIVDATIERYASHVCRLDCRCPSRHLHSRVSTFRASRLSRNPRTRWRRAVLPPRQRLAAAGALAGAAFCYVIGDNLPIGLLPVMSAGLHTSLQATGLLVTIYALVVVVASAPLTYLTRNVPRRLLLSGLLGVFVAGNLVAAAAPGYGWLVAARVVTALTQAVFWSVAPVAAVGLFPAGESGRAVAWFSSGIPLALLLGVPTGTWIGQHAGWRMSFVALAGAGLAAAAAAVVLVPARGPSENHAAAGTHPDALGYGLLMTATLLAFAGTFTAYTYISTFLTKVGGLPAGTFPWHCCSAALARWPGPAAPARCCTVIPGLRW